MHIVWLEHSSRGRLSTVILYEDEYYAMRVESNASALMLHVDWKGVPFTKTVYKKCQDSWKRIREHLKSEGFDEVFSLVPKEELVMKWQVMFGMTPLIQFSDCVLFRRKI